MVFITTVRVFDTSQITIHSCYKNGTSCQSEHPATVTFEIYILNNDTDEIYRALSSYRRTSTLTAPNVFPKRKAYTSN